MPVVKDLLAEYEFKKAKGFDDLKPDVSVVLPTYQRAKNGLLARAIKTLLEQDFLNIEVIIVDDCSTDGTEAVIADFMSSDPRVSTVRFGTHIGQSAISINLGIELSRGQKILCAFDDNVFTKDGLTALVKAQHFDPSCKISYGKTLYRERSDPKKYYFGDRDMVSHILQAGNFIGFSGVLVDRSVYEKVGLYEVHIGVVPYCDWDMWLRANLHFNFKRVDIVVNEESGRLQPDYLKNPAKEHQSLVHEIMLRYRNDILSFSNWKDLDITEGYKNLSLYGQMTLKKLARQDFKGRFGSPSVACTPGDDGYILLISIRTSCTDLTFDVTDGKVLFVHPHFFFREPMEFIRGAKVIIFVREIYDDPYSVSLSLRQLGIPYYFYTDDDLFIEEYVTKHNPYHGTPQAKDFLLHAKGIIATTPGLCNQMRAFNDNIISAEHPFSCTTPLTLAREFERDVSHFKFDSDSSSIRIGCASTRKALGLLELKDGFVALHEKLGIPLELYCYVFPDEITHLTEAFSDVPGIKIRFLNFEYSYPKFCFELRNLQLHFMVHVSTEALYELYPYKTYNYLITASFCNAIPLIINRPPWDKLKKINIELAPLIPETAGEMVKVIDDVVLQPALAQYYLTKCKEFIDEAYPIENNIRILQDLSDDSDGPYLTNDIPLRENPSDLSRYRNIQTRPQFYDSVRGCLSFAGRRVVRVLKKAFVSDVAKLFHKIRSA